MDLKFISSISQWISIAREEISVPSVREIWPEKAEKCNNKIKYEAVAMKNNERTRKWLHKSTQTLLRLFIHQLSCPVYCTVKQLKVVSTKQVTMMYLHKLGWSSET